jgi:lysine/ornithine N-monooxygenase
VVVITYSCQLLTVGEGSSSYLPKDASTWAVKHFYVVVHAEQFLNKNFQVYIIW